MYTFSLFMQFIPHQFANKSLGGLSPIYHDHVAATPPLPTQRGMSVCARALAPALPPSLIPLSCPRSPHTYTGRGQPPLPHPHLGGGRESFSFSVPSHALHAMGDVTKRASPPPGPRAPSLVPPRLLPAKPAPVGLALAYPACSRTSAQPAHSRSPGPRVTLTPHPRRSEPPA